MSKLSLIAVLAISLGLAVQQARAQDHGLVGSWSGEIEFQLVVDGKVVVAPRIWTIVIEEVDGRNVRGYNHWRAQTDVPGYVEEEKVLEANEPLIGSLDTDDVTVRMVETSDGGELVLQLLGPDELEATYIETHEHPVIGTTVLRRVTQ
jgi:hypothetical protein